MRPLEARFASNMLRRFPWLKEQLDQVPAGLESLDEQGDSDLEAVVRWVVSLLIEYRNSVSSMLRTELNGVDPSRLLEALVYQLASIGFSDQSDRIKRVLESLKYQEDQSRGTFKNMVEVALSDLLAELTTNDSFETGPGDLVGVLDDENRIASTRLWRDAWLLLFCSLLWTYERDRSAGVGELALGPDFRDVRYYLGPVRSLLPFTGNHCESGDLHCANKYWSPVRTVSTSFVPRKCRYSSHLCHLLPSPSKSGC